MHNQGNIFQNKNIYNNYECMFKEEQTIITYKTVLNLPLEKADIKRIYKSKGKVACDCTASYLMPKMVSGNIQVDLSYLSPDSGKKENIFFALPFKAPLFSKSMEKIEGSLKYINVRCAGERHIIVDAVAVLDGKGQHFFRDSMQREGNLKNSAKFRINLSLPNISKILAFHQKINIMEYQQTENTLVIKGIKQMELIYIGKTLDEEHVIKDGKVEPFFEKLELDNQTKRLINGVEIFEDNLSAVQLNSREVLFDGSYGLKVIYATKLKNQKIDVTSFIKKASEVILKEQEEKKTEETENIVQQEEEVIKDNPALNKDSIDEDKKKHEKAAFVKRKSKRTKLLKHKRELQNLI